MSNVRVRFAPSPTGYLHIGGVRTALFNWLYARHTGGTFILRIEDTDQTRSTDESIKAILDGMDWCGMDYDEGPGVGGPFGPYRQTERMEIYREHVQRLLESGRAYRCYCTPEELDERRKAALAAGRPPKYDGRCRDITTPPEGRTPVIRFRANEKGRTVVNDLIKGEVSFDNAVMDDLIIMRSDGYPTYNFVVVVDDATMGITHVLRGDDHLNNTPRQIQMYEALGYPTPEFGHLSMILGPDKARLSKRHGATSIMQYKEMGYLPEAMVNYLVRLGWSHGDQEVFSASEMKEKFSLESISSAAAVFNPEKLNWLNHHYINNLPPEHIAELFAGMLKDNGLLTGEPDMGWITKIVLAQRERSSTLAEMVELSRYFFTETVEFDPKAKSKFLNADILPVLGLLINMLDEVKEFTHDPLKAVFDRVMAETGLKMGKVAQPVRVALTGGTVSPGIFETMEIFGRDKTMERLRAAVKSIG